MAVRPGTAPGLLPPALVATADLWLGGSFGGYCSWSLLRVCTDSSLGSPV
jgi:hypothetical protein